MINNSASCRNTFSETNVQPNDTSRLKRRLQKVDFAITETVLYLDAYPNSREALAYYRKLVEERDRLYELLARSGNPMTHFDNMSAEDWQWTKGPWPWQNEAN